MTAIKGVDYIRKELSNRGWQYNGKFINENEPSYYFEYWVHHLYSKNMVLQISDESGVSAYFYQNGAAWYGGKSEEENLQNFEHFVDKL